MSTYVNRCALQQASMDHCLPGRCLSLFISGSSALKIHSEHLGAGGKERNTAVVRRGASWCVMVGAAVFLATSFSISNQQMMRAFRNSGVARASCRQQPSRLQVRPWAQSPPLPRGAGGGRGLRHKLRL